MPGQPFSRRQFIAALATGPLALRVDGAVAQSTRAAPLLPGRNAPALIPRRVLFADADRSVVRISPDGRRIAFLAPLDGVQNLFVAPIDDVGQARPFTRVTDRNLGPWVIWLHNDRHVVFFREQGGDENWQAHRVDLQTGDILPLTPGPGVKSYLQEHSYRYPDELILAHNARDKRYFELFRVNAVSGESTLLQRNEEFGGFFTDSHFRVRLAERQTDDGGREYLRPLPNGEWELFVRADLADSMNTWPIEVSDDGNEFYWMDSRDRDRSAIVAIDLRSGARRVLAADAKSDMAELRLESKSLRPMAAATNYTRKAWRAINPDYAADFAYLAKLAPGDIQLTSVSHDNRHWLLAVEPDAAPQRYFHYDRAARKARALFSARPDLDDAPLVPMQPVVIRARDGLQLVSYLSRPRSARKNAPLPMVLCVHGGPWARDVWGLQLTHQWLANRGYAALSVNYRGSTGFGKAFVNAGNRQWGGKMHDDLIDAVDWAIAQGIADPKRVAIYGISYGGYAALAGVTFTPEKFACAVDVVGISNLMTLMDTIPEYWKPWKAIWKARMGDYSTEEGQKFLHARSPLTYVDRIVRPLLIGHGANDPRVKVAESEQIVAAMQKRGIPVTYVYYPDEGHGFRRPENRRAFNAVTEAFLAKHLGGRFEPLADDFAGSSLEFRAGRELIPGIGG
jgi:dipeptidyl aminopeptidase/acylaminoacyl peptidase